MDNIYLADLNKKYSR